MEETEPNPHLTVHLTGGEPLRIMKDQSSFKVGVSAQSRSEKKITFADDHGDVISEDFFVEHLHYSPSSMTSKMDGPKNCCVIA